MLYIFKHCACECTSSEIFVGFLVRNPCVPLGICQCLLPWAFCWLRERDHLWELVGTDRVKFNLDYKLMKEIKTDSA